jgi:hypothetical protein
MGMVDVMHEMRDMEQRVRLQLDEMQNKVHLMVESAVKNMGSQPRDIQMFAAEFKQAVSTLAHMMDDAAQRFDSLLKKPMLMIEKQMDQQRYMFEEAHKQKDFLERMFSGLLNEQRNELEKLFAEQSYRLQELSELNRQANDSTQDRIGILESVLYDKLNTLEIQIQSQQKNTPQPNV